MAERTRIEQPAILREPESVKAADAPKAAEVPTPPAQQQPPARSGEREMAEMQASPERAVPPVPPEPALSVPNEVLPVGAVQIGVSHAQAGSGMFTVEFPNEVRTYYRARPDEGFSINASMSGKYRVTLRQPNEDGDLRIVGKSLAFEVR